MKFPKLRFTHYINHIYKKLSEPVVAVLNRLSTKTRLKKQN